MLVLLVEVLVPLAEVLVPSLLLNELLPLESPIVTFSGVVQAAQQSKQRVQTSKFSKSILNNVSINIANPFEYSSKS